MSEWQPSGLGFDFREVAFAAPNGTQQTATLDLRLFSPPTRELALRAFIEGDAMEFLVLADNTVAFDIFSINAHWLKARGIYEECLYLSLTGPRTNNAHRAIREVRGFLDGSDRSKLLSCADPLPGGTTFTVYRGVKGRGRERKVGGWSWTLDLRCAVATSLNTLFGDPVVYSANVRRQSVYFYSRMEQEVVCFPTRRRKLEMSDTQMKAAAEEWRREKLGHT